MYLRPGWVNTVDIVPVPVRRISPRPPETGHWIQLKHAFVCKYVVNWSNLKINQINFWSSHLEF